MPILEYNGKKPEISPKSYVSPLDIKLADTINSTQFRLIIKYENISR